MGNPAPENKLEVEHQMYCQGCRTRDKCLSARSILEITGKAMSKLLAVVFVNTGLCIPEFHKDHTVANATVNLKDQINVWFTSQGLSPSLIITNNGASVTKTVKVGLAT